jgi:hypothetical protein
MSNIINSNAQQITAADQDLAKASREADQAVEQQSRNVQVRAGSSVTRFNAATGTAESSGGLTRVNLAERPAGGSILDTGMRNGSNIAAGRLTPDSTVEINGTRTQVKVAELLGFITRGPDGRYQEAGKANGSFNQAATEQGTDQKPATNAAATDQKAAYATLAANRLTGESLPDAQEDARYDILNRASPEATGQALNSVADAALKGTAVDLSELASHLGLSDEQARSTFDALQSAFQTQADAAVAAAGVCDVDAFWQWARENHGAELREATMDQVSMKSTSRFRKLARAFANSGHAGGALDADSFVGGNHAAGIETTKRDGKVIVKVNGVEMELRAAIRAGLVAPR